MAENQTTAPPGELPEEWKMQFAALVNNAFTQRAKAEEKRQEKALEALRAEFKQAFEGLQKPPAPQDPDDGGGKGSSKKDLEISTLRKQQEDLKLRLDAAEAARSRAEEQQRQAALRTFVLDSLTAAQIVGTSAQAAISHIFFNNLAGYDDDGRIVWREDGNPVEYATGFKSWLKTDVAKLFLPAAGTRGSGSRPGGTSPHGKQPLTKEEQQTAIGNALVGILGG